MADSCNKAKSIIKYVLLFILAAVLVYFAFRNVNWGAFVSALGQTRWIWVVIFCLASVCAIFFRAIRWKELLIPFDGEISLLKVWDAVNVGNLTSLALPGAGEFLRCGYVTTKKLEYDKALGTLICERFWDFIAVVIISIVSFAYEWTRLGDYFKENLFGPALGKRGMWWILVVVVVLSVLFVVIVRKYRDRNAFCGRVAASLSRLWLGFKAFEKSENKLLIALSTVVIWAMYILMSFCILKAVPEMSGLNLMDAMFFSAIGNLASVVPVPGGIGAYHYLVASAVGFYGLSWDMGILYATLNHEIHAVIVAILGLVCYLHGVRSSRKNS